MSPQRFDSAPREVLSQAVAAAGVGRYGTATAAVESLLLSDVAPSARALLASCFRQLGAHNLAAKHDAAGIAHGGSDLVGRADCATGWAADAIGTDLDNPEQFELIEDRLGRAARATDLAAGSGELWRLRVRLSWVRAEFELLTTNAEMAMSHADRAVVSSLLHGTQRHLAKSLLVQGVARLAAGRTASGLNSLERSAALADLAELHPLRVPSHGLLGQLTNGATSIEHRALAAHAADLIAADVPPECADWRSRPDVLALTGS